MGVLDETRLAELRGTSVSEGGNRLDIAIRLSRLTQRHIAKSMKIDPAVISTLKLGKRRTLPLDLANQFADYFGCAADELFPPQHMLRELPDLARPIMRSRSPKAGTKRPRRAQRKSPDVLYPLPAHLEKQRLSIFEMLTDARLAKGMTLQEVADRLNRTRQQVEQWESAARHLRIDTLMEWADALGYRFFLEPLSLGSIRVESHEERIQ